LSTLKFSALHSTLLVTQYQAFLNRETILNWILKPNEEEGYLVYVCEQRLLTCDRSMFNISTFFQASSTEFSTSEEENFSVRLHINGLNPFHVHELILEAFQFNSNYYRQNYFSEVTNRFLSSFTPFSAWYCKDLQYWPSVCVNSYKLCFINYYFISN
jgi:hypothetical protein